MATKAALKPGFFSNRSFLFWIGISVAGLILVLVLVFGLLALVGLNDAVSFGDTVRVIPVHGEISSDGFSARTDELSSQEVVDALKDAEDDASVAAVVLDIQSPGGSIVATKQVVAQLQRMQKPVVSWIGDIGASGAYYIAAASDVVMADSDSITGSIGVIGMFVNIEGLLEKIGVKATILREGKFKAIGSPFKELTPQEEELLQTLLHDAFLNFKQDIQSFRNDKLDESGFERVTDGRILSGSQAQKVGLVDELGTREDAIQKAAELGGISGEPFVDVFAKPAPSLLDFFWSAGVSFGSGFKTGFVSVPSTASVIQAQ